MQRIVTKIFRSSDVWTSDKITRNFFIKFLTEQITNFGLYASIILGSFGREYWGELNLQLDSLYKYFFKNYFGFCKNLFFRTKNAIFSNGKPENCPTKNLLKNLKKVDLWTRQKHRTHSTLHLVCRINSICGNIKSLDGIFTYVFYKIFSVTAAGERVLLTGVCRHAITLLKLGGPLHCKPIIVRN